MPRVSQRQSKLRDAWDVSSILLKKEGLEAPKLKEHLAAGVLLTRLAGSRISLTGVALTRHPLAGIALARASRLIRLHRLVVAVVFTSTATNFRIFHLGSFHGLRSVDNFD
jgi:hypothetical protein